MLAVSIAPHPGRLGESIYTKTGTHAAKAAARAYAMCNGQSGAAPATHATIIATLVVPTSGPVVVPTSVPTTLVTASQSPTATQGIFTTSTPVTTVTQAPVTSGQSSPAGQSSQQLGAAQIAGISLGVAGAVLLIIAIFMVARCRRQEKRPTSQGTFAKMRDSWSFGRKTEWSPYTLQISNPVNLQRPELDVSRALQYPAPERPEYIGLAITPQASVAMASPQNSLRGQQQAKNSAARTNTPPKPMLTLTIPSGAQQQPRPLPPPSMPFGVGGRDSVVTEFAEDGEEGTGSAQIWRPPISADPMSATTYYVADKWGNWVLGNAQRRSQTAELEGSSPLTDRQAQRYSISQATKAAALPTVAPLTLKRPQQAQLGPPIQFKEQTPITRSSSVYSNYSLPQTATPGPLNPLPKTLPPAESYQKLMQENAARAAARPPTRKPSFKGKGAGLDRTDSKVSDRSVTTIDEDEYNSFDPEQIILSPVVESPASRHSVGVSPVSYPKIPQGGSNKPDRLLLFPPHLHNSPPGQPSPTLGLVAPAVVPSAQQQQQLPDRKPTPMYANPAVIRDPAQVRTGSPRPPPPPAKGFESLPSQQRRPYPPTQQQGPSKTASPRARIQAQEQRAEMYRFPSPPRQQTPQRMMDPRANTPGDNRPQNRPAQQSGRVASPRANTQEQGRQQQQQQQPRQPQQPTPARPPHQRQSSTGRIVSFNASEGQRSSTPASLTSTSSSLLAKRLGIDRAAALHMGGGESRAGKWQRQPSISQTPPPPGTFLGLGGVPVPQSPAWQPKLTPTRRGDDLVLNVQSFASQ
jgi:hypothetical protein